MRLICPNCATQYEVDDSAVPAAGREVQCGSCASTWFQAPARSNLPASAEKNELPKWVEEIVEEDVAEEAQELPGQVPKIDTAPNEDIVSEPELAGVIETADLDAGLDKIAPDTVTEDAGQAKTPSTADIAKTATQVAAGAAIASTVTGSDAQSIEVQSDEPLPSATAAAETTPANSDLSTPPDTNQIPLVSDDAVDVSTELEKAIKERTAATKEDFPTIAAAELEASQTAAAAQANAEAEARAAIKAAEQAAAVEMAEKAATTSPDIAVTHVSRSETADIVPGLQSVDETPNPLPTNETSEIVSFANSPQDDREDIEAQIKGALEELDAGLALPTEPSEERLSDYDFTQGDVATEKYADATNVEADVSPNSAETESYDPNGDTSTQTTNEDNSPIITTASAVDPMVEAMERDAVEDQTESLAAKLKARVAEAAKAQEDSVVGTAGIVLGASAAGIAATSARQSTEFPKRETEELASSLRPKSVDGNSLKPRLRPDATPEPRQSRFGQGFILALALFALALLVYLFREQLATAVPALEPILSSYATFVDKLRLISQDAFGKLTTAIVGDPES